MNIRFSVYILLVTVILSGSFCLPASAKEMKSKSPGMNLDSRGNTICGAVKQSIQDGVNARIVVKTGIEYGHSACLVVKCAISGGGNLEDVIKGAIEAGATSDVVSKCALDAGADPTQVAKFLLGAGLSLCYFEPEGLGYSPPEDAVQPIPSPPLPPALGPISPSSF